MSDCFICDKHAGGVEMPGGYLFESDLVVASHIYASPQGKPDECLLGHLLIETRRHVDRYSELTDAEAGEVGVVAARLSGALERKGATRVYSWVIGHGVPHFHMHLFPRWAGAPDDLHWTRIDEWEGNPRGDAARIEEFVVDLRVSTEAPSA